MSAKAGILRVQKIWAARAGLQPDEQGYLETYEENLFQPLNEESKSAFEQGSGSELRDRPTGPAKMRAIHSSSALAVNFFDPWVGKETQPLAEILRLESKPSAIEFEGKYPTGLPGNPPNLDVVLKLDSGRVVGIESKFTEWITPKSASKPCFKEKYFPSGVGVWEKVGLSETQRLVEAIRSKEINFRHLDAPQLTKHALGLATHCGRNFQLLYVYFDGTGSEATTHREEIELFSERLRAELGFRAFSYQELIVRLQQCSDVSAAYLDYLKARYGWINAVELESAFP